MQCERDVPKFGSAHARHAYIDCQGLHVQTVDSYTMPVAAKVFITPGGPVTTHHVDLSIGASDAKCQIMKQVEHARIVLVNITRPMIAQVMADPCQGVGIILIAMTIDDVQALPGVSVKEAQPVGGGLCRKRCLCARAATSNE